MNTKIAIRSVVAATLAVVWAAMASPLAAQAESGCVGGAVALGNAYVRSNPLYALYYGDLESYVAQNASQFIEGADAIRCARALSRSLIAGSMRAFDPDDMRRQRELNTRFESMGMSPGTPQPSPAMQLYSMGQNFARLARVLPPAARGNYQPLRTPTTELEQAQMFAGHMMRSMMDRSTLEYIRPLVEESAQLEFKIITNLARAQAGH